jgi:DNA-binding SARP family transcriptional activator/tetratricopeptide (TPR) repeat protein
MTLRLRTFGAVYLERDQAPLGGAHSQRRRLALLAYLAAAEGAAITREKLIALLWPESDEASGRHSLSQLLYALRHDLGAEALVIDSETVRLNASVLPSDVHDFAEALRAGKLEDAAQVYRGGFLDGFHVDEAPELGRWIDEERSRRAELCGRALERLADSAAKAGDAHRAVEWCRRRANLDPMDARATLRLMQALAAVGDREGAVRASRVYETLVREELEAEPDRAVTQLAEELKKQPFVAAPSARSQPNEAAPAATAVALEAETFDTPTTPHAARRASRPARLQLVLGVLGVAAAILFAATRLRTSNSSRTVPTNADGTAVVVIGELEGPDSILALAVREALRAELVNTRGVILTSDGGIRELKTLMRLPHDSTLTQPQLMALATRAGAHVAIEGSVLPVGNGAQIVLELADPKLARSIRTFAERPTDAAAILAAVGRLGRAIGEAITQTSHDPTVHALPAVTTASLPALKSYALARQLAASGRRTDAVAPGERAVTHDSTFALAHYFLGDLLWFIDQQTHSEAHLTKAYQLIATLPPREQLVIRARYEQLVLDRPDSALVYWDLLHDASPGDALAYEGRAWALRALGRHEEAAASADTAMRLDPAAVAPNTNNAMYSLLGVGDTSGALDIAQRVASRNPDAQLEARFFAAHYRGDIQRAIALADSTHMMMSRAWRRSLAYMAHGDVAAARVAIDSMRLEDRSAVLPNALLNLGLTELALGMGRTGAASYAREALDWVQRHDLSPPAVGRLAERIADLAARAGDEATIRATITLVRQRDSGRSLRTYVMTMRTLDAALAFVRGQYAEAARRAEEARHGVYFSRSLATIVQLEADARRAAGQTAAADSLDRLVVTHQIVDGHFEVWAMLRAAAALRANGRSKVTASAVPTIASPRQ